MQIECTGRQVTITKGLRSLAEEGIARINKVLGRITGVHVVLTNEKHRHIAEVAVKTRACSLVAVCESTLGMENALREALARAEAQAVRYKTKLRSQKRQPKEAKRLEEAPVARTRGASPASLAEKPVHTNGRSNGKPRTEPAVPVTVHSFPARVPIAEPHVVRSAGSVALRPMTLEEAVKEAEFRDREVFVFRDNEGNVKVLHRKRDGKMELIEAP
jgi:putative sigma-54 modulation protein